MKFDNYSKEDLYSPYYIKTVFLTDNLAYKFDNYLKRCEEEKIIPELYDFYEKCLNKEYRPDYYSKEYLEYCDENGKEPNCIEYCGEERELLAQRLNILIWDYIISIDSFKEKIYPTLNEFQKRIYNNVVGRYKSFLEHKIDQERLEYDIEYQEYIDYCKREHVCPSDENFYGYDFMEYNLKWDFTICRCLDDFIVNNHEWMVQIYDTNLPEELKETCIKAWQLSSWENLSEAFFEILLKIKDISFFEYIERNKSDLYEYEKKYIVHSKYIPKGFEKEYPEYCITFDEEMRNEYPEYFIDDSIDFYDYDECYEKGQQIGYKSGYNAGYFQVTNRHYFKDCDDDVDVDIIDNECHETTLEIEQTEAYKEGYAIGYEIGFQQGKNRR